MILPILEFPGYFIEDSGIVYSSYASSGRYSFIGKTLKPLAIVAGDLGRSQVNLHRDGKTYTKRVHVLVLTAFVGPKPKGTEACHFPDRDVTNNRLSNLRWDTAVENQRDRKKHGTDNAGTRNPSAKLTASQVSEIRQRKDEPRSVVARAFGVSPSLISMIVHGRLWANG